MLTGGSDVSATPSPMPTGTVTFLLTDVEGSSRRWEATPELMHDAIARHAELLGEAIEAHGGFRPIEQGEGDSIVGAFARASDAVSAAVTAQRALQNELGTVFLVRMAVHTGEAPVRGDANYEGPTIIRACGLRACGHGGQILVSRTTADLVNDSLPDGVTLIPLGRHRLRDLQRPEDVWQLSAPDLPAQFPPLRSLDAFATNLPSAPTSLIGRRVELSDVTGLLRDGATRLVTLTGPGGVGKTRLALEAGWLLSDAFAEGVWLCELAPVSERADVVFAVAQVLRVRPQDGMSLIDGVIDALPGTPVAPDHRQLRARTAWRRRARHPGRSHLPDHRHPLDEPRVTTGARGAHVLCRGPLGGD